MTDSIEKLHRRVKFYSKICLFVRLGLLQKNLLPEIAAEVLWLLSVPELSQAQVARRFRDDEPPASASASDDRGTGRGFRRFPGPEPEPEFRSGS